jgi:ATP-binding cassette subfamily G (WHITE) protein 2 (SNQ2)
MKNFWYSNQLSTNAKVSLWDNSTQGLDSSTSIRFGKSLRVYVESGRNIAVAALYQASDDLVNLFDKVTILSEGRQIFFGTIQEAQDYFTSLGFIWTERQSLSEFFIAVTDPNLRVVKDGWEDRVPRSIDDFVTCWKASACFHKLKGALNKQVDGTNYGQRENAVTLREYPHGKGSYVLTWLAQLWVIHLLKNNIHTILGVPNIIRPLRVALFKPGGDNSDTGWSLYIDPLIVCEVIELS